MPMTNTISVTHTRRAARATSPRAKSSPTNHSAQPAKKNAAAKTRKRYSAKFKLGAVQMISATDPCNIVAKRLGLPMQTLYNWLVAQRQGHAAFSDPVRMSPDEKAWVLASVESRLIALNKRADNASKRNEIGLLTRLKTKVGQHAL